MSNDEVAYEALCEEQEGLAALAWAVHRLGSKRCIMLIIDQHLSDKSSLPSEPF